MRRLAVVLVTVAAFAAGCTGDDPSPFAERAERACRALDRDGFRHQVKPQRAHGLYRRFGRAVMAAKPADDEEERARNALMRYADGATALYARAPGDAPAVDLKLTVGPTVSDLVAVDEADLPGCVDVLKGRSRHDDGQVVG